MEKKEPENKPQSIVYVSTREINVPRERVTSVWDPALLEEFEESVKAKGILEPVQLLKIKGELWLTDGLHRIQIAEKYKIDKVPVIIKDGSTEDLLIENIIRNRQRGKSNPAQEAEVLDFLVNKRGFPLENASRQIGCSVSWAKKLLRISGLPEETKDFIKHGRIPVTGAFFIADLPDPQSQLLVSRDAAEYNYNAHQIKARVGQLLNPDVEPDQGDFKFNSEGKPARVPIRCKYCGEALPQVGKQYIWVCGKCEELTQDLYKYYARTYQTPQTETPGSSPNPPEIRRQDDL